MISTRAGKLSVMDNSPMVIDLSADPARPGPGRGALSRRQLLVAGLSGLVGGSGGAWALMSFADSSGAETVAASVAVVEPAGVPGEFVDLATVGPAVTVTIDRAGRCAVSVSATVAYGSADDDVLSQGGAMSFEVTGANRRPPALERSGRSFLSLSGLEVPFSVTQSLAATVVLDNLRPGRTTFTAKYRAEDGSPVPVFFSDRTLLVAPVAVDG
jgi:hypothetical protein